jgi:hypothetical protein
MEDLLREDDFVIKNYFNHWKYFRKCYLIAIGSLLALIVLLGIMSEVFRFKPIYIGLTVFIIPQLIVGYMIFGQKKLLTASFGTVSLGLFFLLCVFYVPVSLIVISEGAYSAAIAVLAFFTIIPLAVIMPIFNWKQKRLSK